MSLAIKNLRILHQEAVANLKRIEFLIDQLDKSEPGEKHFLALDAALEKIKSLKIIEDESAFILWDAYELAAPQYRELIFTKWFEFLSEEDQELVDSLYVDIEEEEEEEEYESEEEDYGFII